MTGILGEDVYLECVYTGHNVEDLLYSTWKRPESKKKLAGYFGQKLLTSEGFSAPASLSNLTVLRQVLSLDAEGKYTCEFATEEETLVAQLSLTILGKSDSAHTHTHLHIQWSSLSMITLSQLVNEKGMETILLSKACSQ